MKLEARFEPETAPDLAPRMWVDEAVPTSTGATDDQGPAEVRLLVSGDLDEATASSMRSAALASLEADPEVLVLDLSGVVFVDTAGLRSIIETSNDAERCGIRLVVGGMPGGVERLLELTGIDHQLSQAEHWSINPN